MTTPIEPIFLPFDAPKSAKTLVYCYGGDGTFTGRLRDLDRQTGGMIERAASAAEFKPKKKAALEILAPQNLAAARLMLVGLGDLQSLTERDWLEIGGVVRAKAAGKTGDVDVVLDIPEENVAQVSQSLVIGYNLRHYSFKKYKTKKSKQSEDEIAPAEERAEAHRLSIFHGGDTQSATVASAVVSGIFLARDLVNEPANVLTPAAFASKLKAFEAEGISVEVLDDGAMARLGMNALLCVGQGSAQPSFTVVMHWKGLGDAAAAADPLVLVGKGVCFDTGGISIKPAGGMEDMKGDMAGAAAVAGAMLTLARRKAKANVTGIVGLVENMPSATAQRPGDIVTSASGQTIEVINTDAEGRLVLADLLWYAQENLHPKAIVTLATLTGAILVALGKENAGLFSNNDALAASLTEAGLETGETVWRMPLSKKYDKMIDSKIADMKNIGGRDAGSITAAQFVQRFVAKETPWAHLDIAGTAMGSPSSDINTSWGSGYGVRLLDRLCAKSYE